ARIPPAVGTLEIVEEELQSIDDYSGNRGTTVLHWLRVRRAPAASGPLPGRVYSPHVSSAELYPAKSSSAELSSAGVSSAESSRSAARPPASPLSVTASSQQAGLHPQPLV